MDAPTASTCTLPKRARRARPNSASICLQPGTRRHAIASRERAALAWTEHLTLIGDKRAPDDVYAALDAEFAKDEQVKLTMMINVINCWNRLAVGFNLYDARLGW